MVLHRRCLGHDTTLRQHSKVNVGGRAELTEKHVHTKKTGFEGKMWDLIISVPDHCLSLYFSTRKFMQSGQILVGVLCVDNDSGLILVWKIHESAFEMHPF